MQYNYPFQSAYKPFNSANYQKSFYRDANGNVYDERGAFLPFLAGVLVTTPFIFLAKNQNQTPQYYYPPQQAPIYYPMYQNSYQYPMPYFR